MPSRTRRAVPLALLALLAAGVVAGGCQDYNFSPVRYCLIQPGTERVTLSNISTADVLFVVDDSGSMGGEQVKLAESFQAFVDNLVGSNQTRIGYGLEPIDFHIAVTTTSVFLNAPTSASCTDACGGSAGALVCCDSVTSQPLTVPKGCAKDADCTTATGNACRTDCITRGGELTCCNATSKVIERIPQTCPTAGQPCGRLQDRYVVTHGPRLCAGNGDCTAPNTCRTDCLGLGTTQACCSPTTKVVQAVDTCDLGVGTAGALYPRGDFVRAGTNPRVLHFDKSLFCARVSDGSGGTQCDGTCGHVDDPVKCDLPAGKAALIGALVTQFRANVNVGTCGSGQEQGLEAAKRAIAKAIGLDGQSQPKEDDGSPADWPHPRHAVVFPELPTSKLVVVFVGDEDDCSGPEDASTGVIYTTSGVDACVADAARPADQQREFKLQRYADFLTSLGRPLAGAFIVSAVSTTSNDRCEDATCQPGLCCDTVCTGSASVCSNELCGGKGAGTRFLDLSALIHGKGADTVQGSICDPGPTGTEGFSAILNRVAEVVKQPVALQLPTQPASAELTILRITGAGGKTRKTCNGPAQDTMTEADAIAAGYDWWFTGGDDTNRHPTGPTRFVYINRAGHRCDANPGETYSADYLGLVPAAGCETSAADPNGEDYCAAALGGNGIAADPSVKPSWHCDGYVAGVSRGTCLCGPAPP